MINVSVKFNLKNAEFWIGKKIAFTNSGGQDDSSDI